MGIGKGKSDKIDIDGKPFTRLRRIMVTGIPPLDKKLEEKPLTSMLHITDIGYYPKAKHHFR